MQILVSQEHDKRKQDKMLVNKTIDKEITKINKEIDNLITSLSNTTSSVVQKKIEQRIEESELNKMKLMDNVKSSQKQTNLLNTLELAFEILSNPYYIWEK
jgi:hypothetical protein